MVYKYGFYFATHLFSLGLCSEGLWWSMQPCFINFNCYMASTCKYTTVYPSSTHGHIEIFYICILNPSAMLSQWALQCMGFLALSLSGWVWGHGDSVFLQLYPSAPFATIDFILGSFHLLEQLEKMYLNCIVVTPCELHRGQWEGMIPWKMAVLWPGRDSGRVGEWPQQKPVTGSSGGWAD